MEIGWLLNVIVVGSVYMYCERSEIKWWKSGVLQC